MPKCRKCGEDVGGFDDCVMCEDCRADFDGLDLEDQLEELLNGEESDQ